MHGRALCGILLIVRARSSARTRSAPAPEVLLWDLEPRRAERLAVELAPERPGIEARPALDLAAALASTDVCATCTPARAYFLRLEDVRPGTFVAAVGADDHGKQEIAPPASRSTLVVDALAQCTELGELQPAIAAGLMNAEQVHAELQDLLAAVAGEARAPAK